MSRVAKRQSQQSDQKQQWRLQRPEPPSIHRVVNYITPNSPLFSSSGHNSSAFVTESTPKASPFVGHPSPSLKRRIAPRARSGPTKRSSHAGLQLQQRRSGLPDLRHLLAAFSAPPLRQAPQGRRGRSLPGIISLTTTTTATITTRFRPWYRRWTTSPRLCHTANPLILLRKSRIFGQTRICPFPIPTGISYLSTTQRRISPALTVSM